MYRDRKGVGWVEKRYVGMCEVIERGKVCAVGELNPDLILGRDES